MKEIQIGEYVRTNYGIKRIDTIFENRPVNRYGYEIGSDWDGKEYSIIKTTDIVKHSKNIIDLLEIGDFVNGSYIFETGNAIDGEKWVHTVVGRILYNSEIKAILTKEQYENNCYEVEA